jgi:cellulose synthase/poly-beta-1,6-N-acetylglucosamine synthase-like glycosyltransferase
MALGTLFTLYSVYWGTVLISGGYVLWKGRKTAPSGDSYGELPFVSVLVAARNEASVASRLIGSLKSLTYDPSKVEFIIVEDNSTDGTFERLRDSVKGDGRFRVLHIDNSSGKPGALNEGLRLARGDLIFVMDADCVPEQDILLKAARARSEGKHVLVGYFRIVNSSQNLLTRLAVFEELLWRVMSAGRTRLGLSVPMSGCCTVVSREALLKVGYEFKANLTEDAELGMRLLKAGYPGYYLDSFVWQEAPSTLGTLVKQRIRWYRGYLETALAHYDVFRYAQLKKALDSMLMLSTPFFALLTFLSYIFSVASLPQTASSLTLLLFVVGFLGMNLLSLLVLNLGLALIWGHSASQMVRFTPLVYLYTTLISITSVVAIFQMLMKRKQGWTKTERSGYVDVPMMAEISARGKQPP